MRKHWRNKINSTQDKNGCFNMIDKYNHPLPYVLIPVNEYLTTPDDLVNIYNV